MGLEPGKYTITKAHNDLIWEHNITVYEDGTATEGYAVVLPERKIISMFNPPVQLNPQLIDIDTLKEKE